MKPALYFFFLLMLSQSNTFSQSKVPTDVPLKEMNRLTKWVAELPWKNTLNARNVKGLILAGDKVDSAVLHNTMAQLSGQGGGVLYFPEGAYFFNYHVTIPTRVILRGQPVTLTNSYDRKKGQSGTRFEFPVYVPTFTGMGGAKYPAVKNIISGPEPKNSFGIVDIDLNRARVDFMLPDRMFHSRVLILGVRTNNNAMPSMCGFNDGYGWQRHPGNEPSIGVSVTDTLLIAQCTINDNITDDYEMPEYKTNDGIIFTNPAIKFEHGNHPAIEIKQDNEDPGLSLLVSNNYVATCNKYYFKKLKVPENVNLLNNRLVDLPSQSYLRNSENYTTLLHDRTKARFERQHYISPNNDTLRYYVIKPKNYDPNKKYPLMMYYHGIGEIGEQSDLFSHFVYMFERDDSFNTGEFFVILPHLLNGNDRWTNSWTHNPSVPLDLSLQLYKEFLSKYSIDPRQTYATGISLGGAVAWEIAHRYPGLFSNIIVMSAYVNVTDDFCKRLGKTKVYLSAGVGDGFVPVEYSRLMASKLKRGNVDLKYYEYKNCFHWSWVPLTNDPDFLIRLFRYNKLYPETPEDATAHMPTDKVQ